VSPPKARHWFSGKGKSPRGWLAEKTFLWLSFCVFINMMASKVGAVGMPVTRNPPHGSVRALISAYGS